MRLIVYLAINENSSTYAPVRLTVKNATTQITSTIIASAYHLFVVASFTCLRQE